MESLKDYLKKYKEQFESEHKLMVVENHHQHNADPEYWAILLGNIKFNPDEWEGKNAFDFGCGCGRNLYNLSTLANWANIDGCDISPSNAKYAKEWFDSKNQTSAVCTTWESGGNDIGSVKQNYYDFIMSHIVFQHISNYDVRFSIMNHMYNALKEGGLCSLHFMDMERASNYYDNSNTYENSSVHNKEFLISDFEKLGFKNITCEVGNGRAFGGYDSYYIKGNK